MLNTEGLDLYVLNGFPKTQQNWTSTIQYCLDKTNKQKTLE